MSGIWPPDPGGPASHAPALADFLAARGHGVEVVTTADSEPAPRSYPVRGRRGARRSRHARAAALVRRASRRADAVYATSMIRRAAIGAGLARRPLVVKLVSDEVFERATRSGRYVGTLDAFQETGGARTRFLRATRTAALRRARHVFCPSAYLRDVALRWGLDREPGLRAPEPGADHSADAVARGAAARIRARGGRPGLRGPARPAEGRRRAPRRARGSGRRDLVVAGDGPERRALERQSAKLGLDGRVRFLGSVPRETVLRLFRAADASVLPSAWENFPHTVVEALAVGCPVIATAVGGVPEVVRDGENGLLVPPNDARRCVRRSRGSSRRRTCASGSGGRAGLGRGLLRAGRVRDDRGGAREGGVGMKKRLLDGRPLALLASALAVARAEVRRALRRSSTCGCSPPRPRGWSGLHASGSSPHPAASAPRTGILRIASVSRGP